MDLDYSKVDYIVNVLCHSLENNESEWKLDTYHHTHLPSDISLWVGTSLIDNTITDVYEDGDTMSMFSPEQGQRLYTSYMKYIDNIRGKRETKQQDKFIKKMDNIVAKIDTTNPPPPPPPPPIRTIREDSFPVREKVPEKVKSLIEEINEDVEDLPFWKRLFRNDKPRKPLPK